MFEFIRTHRRWMQFILLLLIVPAFAFFGIEGYMGFMSREKPLAEVDGNAITLPEFDQFRRYRLEEMRAMLGVQFDAQAIDTPQFREQLLQEMIDQRVLVAAANQGRYTVSDEVLRQTIADVPALQENGVFSPEKYRQVLASQGMTPADFELRLRSDLILAQVLSPIGQTAMVPKTVMDYLVKALIEERTVAVRRFVQSAYEPQIQVTEQDIKQWYESHADQLRLPESVDIEYIVVDEPEATKGITVSEEEISHYYQQNQSQFGQPERRRISHILVGASANGDPKAKAEAQEKASKLAEEIKADPSRFADLAKQNSEDPGSAAQGGDLGWISRNTLLPEIESVVFNLDKGQVSDVIESPFGYHVAIVTDIQPESVKPLEQVRDEVVSQIRTQLASARFADLASKLTDMVYEQKDALEPIAQQMGVGLRKAQGLSREGLLSDELFSRETPVDDDIQVLLNHPRVRQVAFSDEVMKTGENSGVIEISPGTVLALRVTKVNPSTVPALGKAEPVIRRTLVAERALQMARDEGKQVLASLQEGKQQPSGFSPQQVVTRQNSRDLSAEELRAAMSLSADKVPAFISVNIPDGLSIIEVSKVEPGTTPDSSIIEQFKFQIARSWGQDEEKAALSILRQEFGAVITPEGRAVIDGQVDNL